MSPSPSSPNQSLLRQRAHHHQVAATAVTAASSLPPPSVPPLPVITAVVVETASTGVASAMGGSATAVCAMVSSSRRSPLHGRGGPQSSVPSLRPPPSAARQPIAAIAGTAFSGIAFAMGAFAAAVCAMVSPSPLSLPHALHRPRNRCCRRLPQSASVSVHRLHRQRVSRRHRYCRRFFRRDPGVPPPPALRIRP